MDRPRPTATVAHLPSLPDHGPRVVIWHNSVTSLRGHQHTDATPDERPGHGAGIIAALITWTFVTGLVDAVSYVLLGNLFLATMTGNVVLLGLATVPSTYAWLPVLGALVSFALGALLGSLLIRQSGSPTSLMRLAGAVNAILVSASLLVAVTPRAPQAVVHLVLLINLGLVMGVQNVAARWLDIPDVSTAAVTNCIAGLAVDGIRSPHELSRARRRISSISALFAGALVGVQVLHHGGLTTVLGMIVAILTATAIAVDARAIPWRRSS